MPSYPQYPLKATQHRSNAQHTANCCVFSAFCFSGEWGGYRPSSNARSKTPTPCPRKLVFIHKYKQNKRTKKTHGKAPDFDNFLSVFRTLPLYRLPKNRQLLLNNTPVLAHCSSIGHLYRFAVIYALYVHKKRSCFLATPLPLFDLRYNPYV